ncbi:DNA alkylation repair protein [Barnesiella viscericola]|uniref:HEAT repeat domain-containing protein n=1 Tax=Barnesiella viscericola TaxID=397865 RepID=A0A921SV49_9BACT|nr:DNA alkylation repair protein [Barnesiella viscericola]HJG89034.1 HEAT repeat domain-containing protein [Barnesiella viscericola]
MNIEEIIAHIVTVENGFQHILDAVHQIHASYSDEECYALSLELFENQAYQVRMLSVVLLGYVGVENEKALSFLKERVSRDENWRVQEMLAKSFDFICKERGYERALPLIAEWLADGYPNVVRAVTEGLRIWTSRPYFKEHPLEAVVFLSKHKADSSEYVRKSVGNALRDISKKFPQLVLDELASWDQDDPKVCYTYRLVVKHLLEKEKRGK